jgi:hypothetical protein
MRPGRIALIVAGSLIALAGFGVLLGGGVLLGAYATQRDGDGFFTTSTERFTTETHALTAEPDTQRDDGLPDWVADLADMTVRFTVTAADSGDELFVGIGREVDVDEYLAGVAHDEVRDIDFDPFDVELERRAGTRVPGPPTEQDFWLVSAAGTGTRVVEWDVEGGRHVVVAMLADGAPGVAVDVEFGIKAAIVVPLAIGLLVAGGLGLALGTVLILLGARRPPAPPAAPGTPGTPGTPGEPEPGAAEPPGGPGGEVARAAPAAPGAAAERATPVRLTAALDPGLSRWQWLVKWFLAIPHYVVLVFLWIAFVLLTIVAGFSILFTGRYPPGIFAFNAGVLRWTWRVVAYAFGLLNTDRYPPFSLEPAGYPAELDIDEPGELSRGLVLVKWWLLAIPHYLVLAVFTGGSWWSVGDRADAVGGPPGLIGLLVLIAAVVLLVTGRYPAGIFRLVAGLQRWVFRVIAYAALMTDRYPPFRLDQGGTEPDLALTAPPERPAP